MVINPFTGKEEEEIIQPLKSEPGATNSVVNPEGLGSTFKAPELTEVKAPEVGDVTKLGTQGLGEVGIDTSLIPTPKGDEQTFGQAFGEEKVDIKQPTGLTGLDPTLDKELGDLKKEKEKTVTDTIDSYNIAKGEFERAKGFYKNFDAVNPIFEGVLGDLETIQKTNPGLELTDEQLQQIADKRGLTLEEIKDPTSIYNKLELTDEGRNKFGVTKAQDVIDKMSTNFERGKKDLAFNLEGTKTNINNQIDDVRTSLERNLSVMTAMGVFSGGLRGSGYQQGIDNVKSDGEKTIQRLETMLDRVNQADAENIARLTEDYNKAASTAKAELDDQLKTIKFDTGLQMNNATSKFDISSLELKSALDKINKEFGTQSLDTYNKYLTNMKAINDITASNIDNQQKVTDLQDTKTNQRFNEFLTNDGLLLQNTSIRGLQQEVDSGALSIKRFNDLKNVMQSSITSTLKESGTVNQTDLNTINSLLTQGKTPTEIVAQMQSLAKFTPAIETEEPKVTKIGDKSFTFNQETQKFEEIIPSKPTITPSGNITTVEFVTPAGTKKTLNVDSTAQTGLQNAIKSIQLEAIGGDKVLIGDSFRTTERQQELFDAGKGLVAKPGTSKHETGMAIDIYSNENFDKLTPEQVGIMNKNGWFQTAGEDDLGHFEFKGVPGESGTTGEELTAAQRLQADNLAVQIYGKRLGGKEENKELIREMMRKGLSIDDIQDEIRLGGLGTEFTGDFKSAYENISVGFAEKKDAKNQAALEDKIKEFGGSSTQVQSFLKRLAQESMDTESRKKIKGFELLDKSMQDISKDLKEYKVAGGDTGIFSGNVEKLAGKIGNVKDVELKKLANKVAKTIQVYRQGVSGAAFTESESVEYKNIFPSVDNISELNTALIDSLLESNTISIDTGYEQQMGEDEYNNIFKDTKEAVDTGTQETPTNFDDIFDRITTP